MKTCQFYLFGLKTALALLLFFPLVSHPQSGGEFEISKSLISNGGGKSSSVEFEVTGSIGQPVIGESSSFEFTVEGGFWNSQNNFLSDIIYSNGFEAGLLNPIHEFKY